jgi:RNA polymerase sigma-70 factor (ECF subfamily)
MDVVRIEPIRSVARSDAELLRSFGGSSCAFREFYDRHVRDVRRFLRAQVGDDLADDLTAETFVVVLRRAHAYRATATTARAWLLGIAANLARRNRRTDTRRTRLVSRLAQPRLGAEDGSFDRIDMSEDRAPLRDALSRIASGEREVLLLVALGELSYEEVASVLGIRVGTVRSRLHRARLQMREALEEGDDDGKRHGRVGDPPRVRGRGRRGVRRADLGCSRTAP